MEEKALNDLKGTNSMILVDGGFLLVKRSSRGCEWSLEGHAHAGHENEWVRARQSD